MNENTMDAPMGVAAAVAKPRTRTKRVLLILWRVTLALVVLFIVARIGWRFSGSNRWELYKERNGVAVYTLKQPGTDIEQQKGIVRVHSSLAGLVAWMTRGGNCGRTIDCFGNTKEAQVDDQIQYGTYRMELIRPFLPREFYFRYRFHQIPATKEMWVEFAAVEGPPEQDPCCFRVTNMSNTWRLTPAGNGMIEVEYVINMDWGGYLPDFLANKARREYMLGYLKRLDGILAKFQDAKYDFIREP